MASLSTNKTNGRRKIQFQLDGKRPTIHLGKITKRQAEQIKLHIEKLVAAKLTGHSVPDEASRWVAELVGTNAKLIEDLAKHGLVASPQKKDDPSLKEFIDRYVNEFGPTVKPNTITTWNQCRRLLLEKFDASLKLTMFSQGNAIEFRNHLLTRGNERHNDRKNLAEATVRKRCACAKQFFAHAVALNLLQKNPFETKKVPTNSFKADQKESVSQDLALKVLEKLPNAQWRLLFALARFGGLRIPSEPQLLKWPHIDWENETMLVHSPKTEHHKGHETRIVPIFGELLPYLREAFELADEGEDLVLPVLRGKSNAYCRKPILKAMQAAGISEPWKKLFSTLRANRDTELREDFPGHVVDAWIGHDERVAKRNYLQITEEHLRRAARLKSDAESDAAPVRNPKQPPAKEKGNSANNARIADRCRPMHEHAKEISGGDRNRTCTSKDTGS